MDANSSLLELGYDILTHIVKHLNCSNTYYSFIRTCQTIHALVLEEENRLEIWLRFFCSTFFFDQKELSLYYPERDWKSAFKLRIEQVNRLQICFKEGFVMNFQQKSNQSSPQRPTGSSWIPQSISASNSNFKSSSHQDDEILFKSMLSLYDSCLKKEKSTKELYHTFVLLSQMILTSSNLQDSSTSYVESSERKRRLFIEFDGLSMLVTLIGFLNSQLKEFVTLLNCLAGNSTSLDVSSSIRQIHSSITICLKILLYFEHLSDAHRPEKPIGCISPILWQLNSIPGFVPKVNQKIALALLWQYTYHDEYISRHFRQLGAIETIGKWIFDKHSAANLAAIAILSSVSFSDPDSHKQIISIRNSDSNNSSIISRIYQWLQTWNDQTIITSCCLRLLQIFDPSILIDMNLDQTLLDIAKHALILDVESIATMAIFDLMHLANNSENKLKLARRDILIQIMELLSGLISPNMGNRPIGTTNIKHREMLKNLLELLKIMLSTPTDIKTNQKMVNNLAARKLRYISGLETLFKLARNFSVINDRFVGQNGHHENNIMIDDDHDDNHNRILNYNQNIGNLAELASSSCYLPDVVVSALECLKMSTLDLLEFEPENGNIFTFLVAQINLPSKILASKQFENHTKIACLEYLEHLLTIVPEMEYANLQIIADSIYQLTVQISFESMDFMTVDTLQNTNDQQSKSIDHFMTSDIDSALYSKSALLFARLLECGISIANMSDNVKNFYSDHILCMINVAAQSQSRENILSTLSVCSALLLQYQPEFAFCYLFGSKLDKVISIAINVFDKDLEVVYYASKLIAVLICKLESLNDVSLVNPTLLEFLKSRTSIDILATFCNYATYIETWSIYTIASIAPFVPCLTSSSSNVQLFAIWALVQFGSIPRGNYLLNQYLRSNPSIYDIFQQIQDPRITPLLTKLMSFVEKR